MFETTDQIILSSCYVLGMSTTTIRTFTMNLMTNGAGTTFFPSAKLVGTASIAAVDAETTRFGGKVTVYKRYRVKYPQGRWPENFPQHPLKKQRNVFITLAGQNMPIAQLQILSRQFLLVLAELGDSKICHGKRQRSPAATFAMRANMLCMLTSCALFHGFGQDLLHLS